MRRAATKVRTNKHREHAVHAVNCTKLSFSNQRRHVFIDTRAGVGVGVPYVHREKKNSLKTNVIKLEESLQFQAMKIFHGLQLAAC